MVTSPPFGLSVAPTELNRPFAVNGSVFTEDQGVRRKTTLEGLAALEPAFKEDGVLTAGNS